MKTFDFYRTSLTVFAAFCCATISFAANPILSNAWATQRTGTKLVDVYYDVADTDSDVLGISAEVSTNAGVTFDVAASSFSGNYGYGVTPGTNRHFTWDAGVNLNGVYTEKLRIKIIADDEPVPPELVKIPAGIFSMGDHYDLTGLDDEIPVHEVYISEFLMDKYEVSNEKMRDVMQWAYNNGIITATHEIVKNLEGSQQHLLELTDSTCEIGFSAGIFSIKRDKTNFPCVEVTWFGAQAYCNYRSDIEGFERCIDFSDWSCDWSKNGFRLPTEAEWEKAARGGSVSNYYPWASEGGHYSTHFDGSKANYWGSGDPYEGTPRPPTTPCGYYNGNQIPAGTDMANGYGLYDMAGNVWEWCWDWYTNAWYSQPGATNTNTRGPSPSGYRVLRGGGWEGNSVTLRCAKRTGDAGGGYYAQDYAGFRCIRRFSALLVNAGTASIITPDTTLDTRDPLNIPTNLAPANGAFVNTLMPHLSTSPFVPSYPGRTHYASQWQLCGEAGFGTSIWDSGETTAALTNQTVPEGALTKTNRFYWRVRYKNDAGGWSPHSQATYFALSGAHIRVSIHTLDFGDVIIGNSTQLTLNVENVGNEILNGSVSGISNPFSVVSGSPYVVGVMSNVDVVFSFAPYMEENYAQSATLTGGGGTYVDLTGNGIPEPVMLTFLCLLFFLKSEILNL